MLAYSELDAPGGATVYPSAGAGSAMLIDNMTVPMLTNSNVIRITEGSVLEKPVGSVHVSNVVFSGPGTSGGQFLCSNSGAALLENCSIIGVWTLLNGAAKRGERL